jgi:hypothetical protein
MIRILVFMGRSKKILRAGRSKNNEVNRPAFPTHGEIRICTEGEGARMLPFDFAKIAIG